MKSILTGSNNCFWSGHICWSGTEKSSIFNHSIEPDSLLSSAGFFECDDISMDYGRLQAKIRYLIVYKRLFNKLVPSYTLFE
jgi:hypothetical protein